MDGRINHAETQFLASCHHRRPDRLRAWQRKTQKQVTINSDLIYDVLRSHQPDHLLLEATRQDAARGLTDIHRLAELLTRFDVHSKPASHLAPICPVIAGGRARGGDCFSSG